MILSVYNKNKEALYTGTKQDCLHYIRRERLSRRDVSIAVPEAKAPLEAKEPTPYATTSFENPPEGFFKRIFKK